MCKIIFRSLFFSLILISYSHFTYADTSEARVECPEGYDCEGWVACASYDSGPFNPYFTGVVRDGKVEVEYPNQNGQLNRMKLVIHGRGREAILGGTTTFMPTGRSFPIQLAEGYQGDLCDENAAPQDAGGNAGGDDEPIDNQEADNSPNPRPGNIPAEDLVMTEVRVECPVGVDCNGWKTCVSWADGEFNPFFNGRIDGDQALIGFPDPQGQIRRAIVVMHGEGDNQGIGVANDFNATGRPFGVVLADGFEGPYCGNSDLDALLAELNRLFERLQNDCARRANQVSRGFCALSISREVIDLLSDYHQEPTDRYNPSNQPDSHPFQAIYEFSKEPKCITCHSFTTDLNTIINNDGIQEEAGGTIGRIRQVRDQRQHQLAARDLTNPANCTGCHNNSWEVYGSRGPGIQADTNDLWDWMAPVTQMNFFGDDPSTMCNKFVQNVARYGSVAESIEHHLKEDGRVLWSIRQSIDPNTHSSERNEWTQAVNAWVEALEGDESGWCPE